MCSHRVSVTLVADTGQTPKVQLSMLDDCCGLVVNMVEAFVYCWQVMRIWERKEIMGKPMMPIWMMTGVLTMSKAVSGMLCWPPANWQLSASAEMHGSCCVQYALRGSI